MLRGSKRFLILSGIGVRGVMGAVTEAIAIFSVGRLLKGMISHLTCNL